MDKLCTIGKKRERLSIDSSVPIEHNLTTGIHRLTTLRRDRKLNIEGTCGAKIDQLIFLKLGAVAPLNHVSGCRG